MKIRRLFATASLAALAGAPVLHAAPASAEPVCPGTLNVIASNQPSIVGTECPDLIFAGPSVSSIHALGGDDIVNVQKQPGTAFMVSTFDLGTGDDRITSFRTSGDNFYLGGPGADRIETSTPAGQLIGVLGQHLRGGNGDDTLLPDGTADVEGGGGNDLIRFSEGIAAIALSPNPVADGGAGNDVIDTRHLEPGFDLMVWDVIGGAGDDVFQTAQSPAIQERLRGDAGTDVAQVDHTDLTQSVEKVAIVP